MMESPTGWASPCKATELYQWVDWGSAANRLMAHVSWGFLGCFEMRKDSAEQIKVNERFQAQSSIVPIEVCWI